MYGKYLIYHYIQLLYHTCLYIMKHLLSNTPLPKMFLVYLTPHLSLTKKWLRTYGPLRAVGIQIGSTSGLQLEQKLGLNLSKLDQIRQDWWWPQLWQILDSSWFIMFFMISHDISIKHDQKLYIQSVCWSLNRHIYIWLAQQCRGVVFTWFTLDKCSVPKLIVWPKVNIASSCNYTKVLGKSCRERLSQEVA